MTLNPANFERTHLAMAYFLQHRQILDDNHTTGIFNGVFFTEITQHPVHAFAGCPNHVREIGVGNLLINENGIICLMLTVRIAQTNQRRG